MTRRMAEEDSRYFLPRQFENPLNALDHEHETGVEILQQMDERVDAFVSGYGTGGTLAGCAKALRKASATTLIAAMEPAESALLSGEKRVATGLKGSREDLFLRCYAM